MKTRPFPRLRALFPAKSGPGCAPLHQRHRRKGEDSHPGGSLEIRALNILDQFPDLVVAVARLQAHGLGTHLERLGWSALLASEQSNPKGLVDGLFE